MHRLVVDIFAFQLLVYAPNSSLELLSAIHKKEVRAFVEIILLIILCIVLAIALALDKAKDFVKQFKSDGSAKLGGFEATVSFAPIDNKKSEIFTFCSSMIK